MLSRELVDGYNAKYATPNFFGYRGWLYRWFVRALVAKTGLKPGDKLLDAGCGQGFFSGLFADCGIDVTGVDLSKAGILTAQEQMKSKDRVTFEVADICELPYRETFDCVFARSCSLYNTERFEVECETTDRLLTYVRPGGTLIFDYYTNLGATTQPSTWRFHSLDNLRNHFSKYPGATVYFSLRIEAVLLRKFAFTPVITRLSSWLSRTTRVGGELIALVRKI